MKLLDGKKLADKLMQDYKSEVLKLKKKSITPGLAVILVGNDSASEIYVRNKEKACREVGILSKVYRLKKNTGEKEILSLIQKINSDKKIHGLLVQLPLPKNINEQKIIEAISSKKDVDCFHPENLGKLFLPDKSFLPCTPAGILELLKFYKIKISGKDVVIVGASNIVGKPLSIMLFSDLGATITLCQEKTRNLKDKIRQADILITAVGKPDLIKANMIKPDAIIIDVGMNRKNGKLVGDVDFKNVKKIAGAITPVPGGVGPMTVAMLIKNTLKAAKIK
jgi:methylenetetrahydrofolate dehydrogenase (NADP+)/methenyltetrahydrofolate cyclohydrolase